jgi:hypothetical protein
MFTVLNLMVAHDAILDPLDDFRYIIVVADIPCA